jgi:phosphatidylserine/phosphatidylglycerophosphate/cardiolipin synthase-like enzyme
MLYSSLMGVFYAETCKEGEVLAIFSPENSDEILVLLDGAKREIKLEVYEFSYKTLADALIAARSRGVDVQVILEPSVAANTKTSEYLLNGGVRVAWASKKFHNTHSKFAVIDDSIVLVGSTNWSKNAMEYNREASAIIYSKGISERFERIFDMDFNG